MLKSKPRQEICKLLIPQKNIAILILRQYKLAFNELINNYNI